jgi:hypothetical protein
VGETHGKYGQNLFWPEGAKRQVNPFRVSVIPLATLPAG